MLWCNCGAIYDLKICLRMKVCTTSNDCGCFVMEKFNWGIMHELCHLKSPLKPFLSSQFIAQRLNIWIQNEKILQLIYQNVLFAALNSTSRFHFQKFFAWKLNYTIFPFHAKAFLTIRNNIKIVWKFIHKKGWITWMDCILFLFMQFSLALCVCGKDAMETGCNFAVDFPLCLLCGIVSEGKGFCVKLKMT